MPSFQKYRVIIAHSDLDQQRYISRLLTDTKLFQVILTTGSGEVCLHQTIRHQPDLVIADAALAGMDGLEVLRQLKRRACTAKVMLCTTQAALLRNREALDQADQVMLVPFTGHALVTQAMELAHPMKEHFTVQQINNCTAATLAILNGPPHMKGYSYVNSAIQLVIHNPDVIRGHAGSYGLYPQLCRAFDETYRNIERCIRTFSDHIFENSKLTVLEQYFTDEDLSRSRIPNIRFISILAAHIIQDLRDLQNLSEQEEKDQAN